MEESTKQPGPEFVAIAIDGPAASGKSSVARSLAKKLGYLYVNSGSLYRAMTWVFLKQGIPTEPGDAVRGFLKGLDINCGARDGASTVRIDGEDPGDELQSQDVNRNVSAVSAIPEVRELLVAKLVAYRELDNIVMEGRDIGSVVLPDTPYKFYIDASQEVRDRRRRDQGQRDEIRERDQRDSSRAASPLVVAPDARVIDTTKMTVEEVVQEILSELRGKGLDLDS